MVLARRSAVYALGGLAYKGIALVAVPLLARLLTPAELGLLDAAAITSTLLALIAGLGTEQGVAWLESRVSDERRLWASALVMVAISSLALVAAAIALQDALSLVLTGDPSHGRVIVLSAIYGSAMAFTAAALNVIRLRSTPIRYAIGSFAVVTAEMTAAIVVAWLIPDPVEWMVLGWAGSAAAVTGILLWSNLPGLGRPDLAVMRRLAAFGLPLVPAAIAWLVGDLAIRSALAREANLATLGEYGIAYRIASALTLIVVGFAVGWHPYLFRSAPTDVLPRARAAMPVLAAVLGVGAITMSLLSPEIVHAVAGPGYAGAVKAVPFLAAGVVALGLFTLAGGVIGAAGSTRTVAIVALSGMAIQVAIAVPLIDAMGLAGGGLASLLGYAVAAVALMGRAGLPGRGMGALELGLVTALTSSGLVAAQYLMDSTVTTRAFVWVGVTLVAVLCVRLTRRSAAVQA